MTGLKWGEDNMYGCPLCRTCRFDNVCFNHSSQDVQFYVGDGQLPLFYDAANGEAHYEFPPDFINTGAQLLRSVLQWQTWSTVLVQFDRIECTCKCI